VVQKLFYTKLGRTIGGGAVLSALFTAMIQIGLLYQPIEVARQTAHPLLIFGVFWAVMILLIGLINQLVNINHHSESEEH
jgi:hypothetical protein